jgi:hypothetical protein
LFTPTVEGYLRRSGALLFPRLPNLPFDPYRAQPYDALELYGTGDYASSLDAVVYAWSHVQPIGSLAAELSADASLIAPLILVGRQHWTDTYPAWPLLQRLGDGRPMGELIYCVDDVNEATSLLPDQSRPR